MSWSYRIVKTKVEGSYRWAVHEVYWDEDFPPGVRARTWTEDPVGAEVWEEELEEEPPLDFLRWELEQHLKALDHPVVDGTHERSE